MNFILKIQTFLTEIYDKKYYLHLKAAYFPDKIIVATFNFARKNSIVEAYLHNFLICFCIGNDKWNRQGFATGAFITQQVSDCFKYFKVATLVGRFLRTAATTGNKVKLSNVIAVSGYKIL